MATKAETIKHSLSKEQMLQAYQQMLLIRRFEERAGQAYGMGLIGGFCHLYIGQEAVVTGINMAQEPQDTAITSYRDHGHMLVCGMSAKEIMAELMGKIGGSSKGKGGSMHMFSRQHGFYGGHGIVGAYVSLGTGIGFAHKYMNNKAVSVTYYGDGASNQGQVFESMNLAALYGLPVLYVIENNQYGMGTSCARSSSGGPLYARGKPLGIEGEIVDGMDLEAVYNRSKLALDRIRETNVPYIIECDTYRYRGHSMSDPAKYRTKEEVEKFRSLDPIEKTKFTLLEKFAIPEKDLESIEEKIIAEVMEAMEFAKNSPLPDVSELYTDVYVD